MKTLIRALVSLLLALWLGAVAFFPVVAGVSFAALPDAHTAGGIVRLVLGDLQAEGLVCGAGLVLLLVGAQATRAFGRNVLLPLLLTLILTGLTAYSQWGIVPRMEADRLAVGGSIDAAPPGDPHRVEFNQLHRRSVAVEEAVLVGLIITLVVLSLPPLVARVPPSRAAGTLS